MYAVKYYARQTQVNDNLSFSDVNVKKPENGSYFDRRFSVAGFVSEVFIRLAITRY